MYFKNIETSKLDAEFNTITLRKAAAARLKNNRINARMSAARPGCKPNAKAHARLMLRITDHTRLMDDSKHDAKVQDRINAGGFHRPGSNTK